MSDCSISSARSGLQKKGLGEHLRFGRALVILKLLTLILGIGWATVAPVAFAQQSGVGDGKGSSAGQASVVGAAQKMALRRQHEVSEIQAMLSKAEADRAAGMFSNAYVGYATALKSTPKIPATAELRRTIFSRYQIGAMDYAKQLADGGQPADAQTVLSRVLADARDMSLDASAIRADFRKLMAELKDPEIHNPVRTPQHIADVATVSKLLLEAQGAVALADFDKAHDLYIRVLNTDRYNEAAARGLEKLNRMIYEYEKTAHYHTRARFNAEVEGSWEMPLPAGLSANTLLVPDSISGAGAIMGQANSSLSEKLSRIVIPSIQFDNAPLRDVLNFLSQRAAQVDTTETDISKRGINIIIGSGGDGDDVGNRPISIKLANVPLDEVLRYVTGQAQLTYRVDQFAVSVVSFADADDKALVTRSFVVPPDFISADGGAGGGGNGAIDPFAAPAPNASGATLVKRMSAEEFLKLKGIDFPEGSSATYMPSTNRLLVRNTPDAVSFVDAMVTQARSELPKMVEVTFKMISVGQIDLEESGFDWLMSPANVDSGATTFVTGGTPGNQPARTATDFPLRNLDGTTVGSDPITAGLRSGDVRTSLSIDDVIERTTASPTSTVAPGIFGVANVFGDTQFQSVWRGLNQSTGVDRMCETSIYVKPGQSGSLKAIREFIYPTEYDPPEVPNSVGQGSGNIPVTPANPTAFETRELGKVVEVSPLVSDDNVSINVSITVDMTEFIGFINYGSPVGNTPNRILQPVFEAVRETTNVTVWDGQTIVIGGFIGDQRVDVEDKVPGLGHLPLVGRLFESSVEQQTARAIVLFVGVKLVDPSGARINQPVASAGPVMNR